MVIFAQKIIRQSRAKAIVCYQIHSEPNLERSRKRFAHRASLRFFLFYFTSIDLHMKSSFLLFFSLFLLICLPTESLQAAAAAPASSNPATLAAAAEAQASEAVAKPSLAQRIVAKRIATKLQKRQGAQQAARSTLDTVGLILLVAGAVLVLVGSLYTGVLLALIGLVLLLI